MEGDSVLIEGSPATNLHKPVGKGRKKKSALAKLAEKKRLNSDGGSEYGSTASLKKQADSETKDSEVTEEKIQQESKKETDFRNDSVKEVDVNNKKDSQEGKEDNVTENKDTAVKNKVPKPQPRKVKQQKDKSNKQKEEEIQASLEGGTVVSIYDKVEKTPTGRKKKELYTRHRNKVKDTNDSDEKQTNRKLFPGENKLDKGLSFLGPVKARHGLSPLDDLPPIDGDTGPDKLKNVELSPPIPMDIDDEIEKDKETKNNDYISSNAPSDATVHRFRALRMTPDRCKSEESLKNIHFVPKPPSTPRSGRASTKGEKRNREANSSGEEADNDAKKQISDINTTNETNLNVSNNAKVTKMDTSDINDNIDSSKTDSAKSAEKKGLSIHPDAFVNSGIEPSSDLKTEVVRSVNNVQNENTPANTVESKSVSVISQSENNDTAKEIDKVPDIKNSQDNNEKKKEKKKSKIRLKKSKVDPQPMVVSEDVSPSKASIDTIGSASDLKAITESYQQVLKADSSQNKYSEVYPGSVVKHSPGRDTANIPEPSPGIGKLSPIQPKNLPPPLPHDMKSTSLRTTYKTDPSYTMNKFFGRSLSGVTEREKLHSDTMSQRSFSTTTALHPLSTREARDRMKAGNIGATLLSSSELDRYFPDRKVGLWVGSWNMAEIKDCREPLDDFLLPEVSEYVQDIYAIGTQENAMSKKEWEILLQETLGPSHVLFHSASHGALHLAVFIKRDLIWFCTVPEDDLVQTRAVTMVKTKGAIAVSFNFFGTSFLFINSHFAPGDGKKKDRLDDYSRIIKQLNLPKTGNTGSPSGSNHDVTTRFDCVFWTGDLNFRIEVYKGKQAVEDIVQYIQEQEHPNFEDLVAGDQLTQLIVEGNIFQGFQEGRINFRPTYKYDLGKDTYDTSAKNRIPSYTDRVLFRARKKNSITCTHYDSPTSIKVSDHRPVFAMYEAAIQPARECTHPLAAGQFDRAVYTEANKRLSMKVDVVQKMQRKEKNSAVCSIQ